MKTNTTSSPSVNNIFDKDDAQQRLRLFSDRQIKSLDLIYKKNNKIYIKSSIDDKERPAKKEEILRELWIMKLIDEYDYPKERIKIEKEIWFGSSNRGKKADIVVLRKDMKHPYIIIEVKSLNRKDGIEQLKTYCAAEGSPIGVWSNGSEVIILHREEPNVFTNISNLPTVNQSLQDVVNEPWTLNRLNEENKLVKERLSLKSVIQDLEDLVLSNSGVDAFEEIFKLIYAKLYDEWAAKNLKERENRLNFRVYSESPDELFKIITQLFEEAKMKWKGIFQSMDKIELSPNHLVTCVSFLQDLILFNSNLQVIDEAFEYLVTQISKGSKGQYFTPRYVIDMAIKMLNPNQKEFVIDTAAGSCGFTVHTIFWVWNTEFIAGNPTIQQTEYASTHVFGLDFDARAVKIAKALNLIAGDGKTNVYKCNSLEPKSWNEEARVALRPMLKRYPNDMITDDENQKNFEEFDFDVLLTNPPFAGDIQEKSILRNYALAERKGKAMSSQGRDILFIERNLRMLRDGGRMAIVLPQGRFNSKDDDYVRKFIMDKARILAVVGLHVNTFKPHTGTKTSVLFIQKWHETLCPRKEDYPIFFATSERPGKDSSGNTIYKKDENGRFILDNNGYLVIDHDLDQITTSFQEFAKQEKFSFRSE